MSEYALLSPGEVIERIAAALPQSVRSDVILVGSLAAGYQLFPDERGAIVRTKDVDCLLAPRIRAITAARQIAQTLVEAGWTYHAVEGFPAPGKDGAATASLPAVRLAPPGGGQWFLELLGAHAAGDPRLATHEHLPTSVGHFVLPTHRFLALAERDPTKTELGLRVARPEAMALGNLLAHPRVAPTRMSAAIGGLRIKRSNKDLGRAIAIASLTKEEAIDRWEATWWDDLKACFASEAPIFAMKAGDGLRELVASELDLEEARHTCQWGLLASRPPTAESLRALGRRLLQDVLEPLAQRGRAAR